MRRNFLVLAVMAVALGLMISAGIMNYLHRRDAQQARMQGMRMGLAPDNGGAANAPDTAQQLAATDADPYTTPLNGQKAPNFTLEDIHGNKVSLASFKGHPMIVDFWATWCGPCKVEIPWFEKLHDEYAKDGLEIIGVSADDYDADDPAKLFTEKRDIADFATKMHMNYPVLYNANSIANQWGGIDSLPTTFFINREGTIVASTVGLAPMDEIKADIQKAIGNGASS